MFSFNKVVFGKVRQFQKIVEYFQTWNQNCKWSIWLCCQFDFAYKIATSDSLKLFDFCGLYNGTSLTLSLGLLVILWNRHQGKFNSQNDKRTYVSAGLLCKTPPKKYSSLKKDNEKQTIKFTLFEYKIKFCQLICLTEYVITSKSCSLVIKIFWVDEAHE